MYQIDNSTAVAAIPASTAAGTAGYFTDGNPATGVPATIMPAEYQNMLMMEMLNVLAAAGINPSKSSFNQLALAIRGLSSGAVGQARNLKASISSASATATWTADEIIVETALGGQTYRLANFNKTVNLATTGAGGMDTGTAPVSGYVGIYAIYNPTTGVSTLLGVNAATLLPEVYGGANMPTGYTASALISVWPTNASSQLITGFQLGREINRTTGVTVLSGSSLSTTFGPVAVSAAVPLNAKSIGGTVSIQATAGSGGISMNVASDSLGTGSRGVNGATATTNGLAGAFENLLISTAQLIYFNGLVNGPTAYTDTIVVGRYTF
ncbi:hypothetical protein [Pseudomonas bohemica]|uniref:hypothetical protein n=1 Tax=Pseudomonas bohemica TaxID=2044872 RepID=UPI000DA62173|nr:hypothetical protein [Pseudomonas bohemica]